MSEGNEKKENIIKVLRNYGYSLNPFKDMYKDELTLEEAKFIRETYQIIRIGYKINYGFHPVVGDFPHMFLTFRLEYREEVPVIDLEKCCNVFNKPREDETRSCLMCLDCVLDMDRSYEQAKQQGSDSRMVYKLKSGYLNNNVSAFDNCAAKFYGVLKKKGKLVRVSEFVLTKYYEEYIYYFYKSLEWLYNNDLENDKKVKIIEEFKVFWGNLRFARKGGVKANRIENEYELIKSNPEAMKNNLSQTMDYMKARNNEYEDENSDVLKDIDILFGYDRDINIKDSQKKLKELYSEAKIDNAKVKDLIVELLKNNATA